MDDREWMYTGHPSQAGMTTEWVTKTNEFVEAAFARGQRKSWCPCLKCRNGTEQSKKTMCVHLQKHGFKRGYTRWTLHGEPEHSREEVVHRRTDNNGTGIVDMVADFNDAREEGSEEEPEESASAYVEMLNSSQQPLHDHTNQCQLDAIAQAMSIKTQFNMSRDCFNSMVTSWGRSLPEGHKLAKSWYEAKKILRALKMPYEQIHACPNGCVLFTKEYADNKYYAKCKASRYVERDLSDGTKKQSKVPANVLRYFPILPRIQRLYLNEDTAKQMTWHKYGIRHDKDDHGRPMLIHPSCAQAWKSFDRIHHEKAKEAKNARVAIGIDGFNPFGMVSKTYSCWPVFVVPLNLPQAS